MGIKSEIETYVTVDLDSEDVAECDECGESIEGRQDCYCLDCYEKAKAGGSKTVIEDIAVTLGISLTERKYLMTLEDEVCASIIDMKKREDSIVDIFKRLKETFGYLFPELKTGPTQPEAPKEGN